MSADDLTALKREHPGWTIAFYTTSVGEHYTATLPGVVVKAASAKALRKRLADGGYTARAVAALTDAAAAEADLGAWLARVLTEVAADWTPGTEVTAAMLRLAAQAEADG